MKNVIYINCWVEPWIEVAKTLKDQYGYNPVWWIGYSKEDNSHNLVPQNFPGIVFQDHGDAWKGKFPYDVQERSYRCYLDVDFLNKHANHELQAIKMMDRMDQDLRSFNFMERQRHFRNMLKSWMAVIDLYKPDLIVSTAIPHRLYDYVLFWLCKEKGIPFLTIQHTQFTGRFYFSKSEFYTIGNRFVDDWHQFEKESNIDAFIPESIMSTYEKVKKDYKNGIPISVKKLNGREKERTQRFAMIRRWLRLFPTKYKSYLLGQPADATIIGLCALDKKVNKKYEESEGNVYQHERMILYMNKYKKKLKETYESLTTPPDYNEDYVVCFLHYQPEATSCPGGDIFVDQRLCIELLLKYLPSNYKIYVREHPHQFSRMKDGHTSRMRDLYDDLIKNKRVLLISTEVDPFILISKAKAVCTITGTVGWEAMVRQKPVIAFGLCWYQNYSKGVLRITDENSARNIQQFIESYRYDEHSLKAYLASVARNTYCADYFKASKKDMLHLSKEENVETVVKSIVSCL